MDFSRFNNKYKIEGRLIVLNALHIGSGMEKNDHDSPFIENRDGEFYIPGSSFRGYLSTKLERLVSEENGIGLGENGDKLNLADAKLIFGFTNLNNESEEVQARVEKKLGITGVKSMAGKIHIGDMPLLTEAEAVKRDGIKISRDTGATENGAKFDYDVVPAGTEFELSIELENVEKYQLELVYLALRDILEGDLFGGMLSRGIGKCKVELENIKYVDASDKEALKDYIFKGSLKNMEMKEFEAVKNLELL